MILHYEFINYVFISLIVLATVGIIAAIYNAARS